MIQLKPAWSNAAVDCITLDIPCYCSLLLTSFSLLFQELRWQYSVQRTYALPSIYVDNCDNAISKCEFIVRLLFQKQSKCHFALAFITVGMIAVFILYKSIAIDAILY